MYINSGSKGFRPLESKMILVRVPALCIKRIRTFVYNERYLLVFREPYGIYFFTVIFCLRVELCDPPDPLSFTAHLSSRYRLTRYRKQFMGKEDKVHMCSLDIKDLGI